MWKWLKQKQGGTMVGNFARSVIANKSGGVFGNGALRQAEGESKSDYQKRLMSALGQAAVTLQNAASNGKPSPVAEAFEGGAKKEVIKRIVPKILIGLAIVVGLIKGLPLLFRKKRAK